jgi:glutaryl-CoA dehydrogenase
MTAFFGVHFGLCLATVAQFGSEAQRRRWLGALQRFEMVGAWAMTEPGVGSDAAAGIATTARRHGRDWVLNGQKSWVGNAPFADLIVIFARDVQDGAVKAFLVESDTPGLHIDKMQGKIALRTLENGAVSLHDCIVSNGARLPGIQSFDDVRPVLTESRVLVAWEAAGIGQGAYEAALAYAAARHQFGKPIAAFQLIQEKLVRLLATNIAMQSLLLRLAQLGAGGAISAERAALAKYFCAQQMREAVALAREVHGVNGILLDHNVARLFADAEAVFSYEGTQEMNLLIVGKALTGISAFV